MQTPALNLLGAAGPPLLEQMMHGSSEFLALYAVPPCYPSVGGSGVSYLLNSSRASSERGLFSQRSDRLHPAQECFFIEIEPSFNEAKVANSVRHCVRPLMFGVKLSHRKQHEGSLW
jgi:hypothetical protein